jgi:hypothetical protein
LQETAVPKPAPLAVAVALAALVRAPAGAGASGSAALAARATAFVPNPVAFVLRPALERALDALERPSCRSVFGYFRDASGRPLAQRLAEERRTEAERLLAIRFLEGYGGACVRPGVAAYTTPGSERVTVCVVEFRRLLFRDRSAAAALLIHEELHVLGLGEDPPTSADITAAVRHRCDL